MQGPRCEGGGDPQSVVPAESCQERPVALLPGALKGTASSSTVTHVLWYFDQSIPLLDYRRYPLGRYYVSHCCTA